MLCVPRAQAPLDPRRGGSSRRLRALGTAFIVLVTAAVMGVVSAKPVGAWAPASKARPVLFVHGIDENWSHFNASTDCGADFNQMTGQMRIDGFNGQFVRVGYYAGDTNCDANLHASGTYGDRDSWKAISKAFSWFVWNNYSRYNIEVDVVGYSMGGLITRGAIYGARRHEQGFSPELNVGGAVTLGTPHYGTPLATACAWGQCSSLDAYHPDMVWLRGDCNPQAWFGTMWTVFGSNDDPSTCASWYTALNSALEPTIYGGLQRKPIPRHQWDEYATSKGTCHQSLGAVPSGRNG